MYSVRRVWLEVACTLNRYKIGHPGSQGAGGTATAAAAAPEETDVLRGRAAVCVEFDLRRQLRARGLLYRIKVLDNSGKQQNYCVNDSHSK